MIPAFELLEYNGTVPANRSQLLQYMEEEKVTGYR